MVSNDDDAEKQLKRVIDKENGVYQEFLDEDVSYLIIKRVASRNYFVMGAYFAHGVVGERARNQHHPH